MKRDGDNIYKEEFEDFNEMKDHYNKLKADAANEEWKKLAACILFKDNNFWMYHTHTVDNQIEEKTAPGDKLWLVMRHMANDRDYDYRQNEGYKLTIGETVKFGRVRYKVIMYHNDKEGLQEFSLLDRLQRREFEDEMRRSGNQIERKKSRK